MDDQYTSLISTWKNVISDYITSQSSTKRGFIQYFDNGYGIFAYETLADLIEIGAERTRKLLTKALLLVNPNGYSGEKYLDYIYLQQYKDRWESLSAQLDQLDSAYYGFDNQAEPIQLLADYYRKRLP
jgi:hypothetical protein